MNSILKDKLSLGFVGLSFLAGAIVYWTIPVNDIDWLSTGFIVKWCVVVILIGFISFPIGKKRPLLSSMRITIGFVSAIMVRIFHDVMIIDRTSHALWPLEIVISTFITFPIAFIAASIIFQALRKKVVN